MGSANKAPRRVLVIDDDLDGMQSLAMLLRHMGHDVEFAINGHAGLDAARRMKPEYVFLDLNLPGIDGFEVARRLTRELGAKSVHIIAITGHDGDEWRTRSLASGCEKHLVKPVDPMVLLKLLDSA